ncbi:MAG: hypothetical protein K0S65_6815 [Labilithrix sp.]|nr:hypothetical protein [Labilithrix sp.]
MRRTSVLVAIALSLTVLAAKCRRHPGTVPDGGPAPDASTTLGDAGPADAWAAPRHRYQTATGRFQIRFPEGKAPEVEEKTISGGIGTVHIYKVQYGTSGYIVSYDDLARGSSRTTEQILDGARNGVLEATGGTMDSERPVMLDGYPGIDLAVSATTSGIKMRQKVRVLLVDGRLYQVVVVAPVWSGATAIEDEFFESFNLLTDAGP